MDLIQLDESHSEAKMHSGDGWRGVWDVEVGGENVEGGGRNCYKAILLFPPLM